MVSSSKAGVKQRTNYKLLIVYVNSAPLLAIRHYDGWLKLIRNWHLFPWSKYTAPWSSNNEISLNIKWRGITQFVFVASPSLQTALLAIT